MMGTLVLVLLLTRLLITLGSDTSQKIDVATIEADLEKLGLSVLPSDHNLIPGYLQDLAPFLKASNWARPSKMTPERLDMGCIVCKAATELVIKYVDQGKDVEEIVEAVINICLNFKIAPLDVCEGAIRNYAPEILYIVKQKPFTKEQVCGLIIGGGCGGDVPGINDWHVSLPDVPKPPVQPPQPPKPGSPTLKILQLSDSHVDQKYEVGSNAFCGKPMCCMNISGPADTVEGKAGYWGHYECDIPVRTLENMLQHIKDTHKDIDYIMLTGDYPAHDVWIQSPESCLDASETTAGLVRRYFPDTPVYPSIGNHEAFPINSFSTPDIVGEFSQAWLYEGLSIIWKDWLPMSDIAGTFKGGFYTVPVRPGLRIITVNSNYCNNFNWWLLMGTKDPAGELSWLMDELVAAEKKSEKVHLLSHIPPGTTDCLPGWARNFAKIINRFEDTVVAQFYGHSHNDEFEIFYDPENSTRATNVAYITPSATTYVDRNPAYRIYTVDGHYDGSSWMILDYEDWTFNMTKANVFGMPQWYRMYSPRTDLGIENLFPKEWDRLVHKMVKDEALFQKYYRYYSQDCDTVAYCDTTCKKDILCRLVTAHSGEKKKCAEITAEIDSFTQ